MSTTTPDQALPRPKRRSKRRAAELPRSPLPRQGPLRLRPPRAQGHSGAGLGAALRPGRQLRALRLVPLPDGLSRVVHLGRHPRSPAAPGRGLPPRRSLRRSDDAALHAHRLSRPPVVARPARGDAGLRPRLLRLDLPVWHPPPLLRVDLPLALRQREQARRVQQDLHAAAGEVLPALLLPRRGRHRERHRRALRPDLHRRPRHRPRRHPRGAVRRRGDQLARRAHRLSRAPGRLRRRSGFPRRHRLAREAVLFPPDVADWLSLDRGPLHEPLHPAVLVPCPLPARRVPRRLRPLRPLRDGGRITANARTATCASSTARAPTRPRAASNGARTSATCA